MLTLLFSLLTQAHAAPLKPVLADLHTLERVEAKLLKKDTDLKLGYALVSEAQEEEILRINHSQGRCGGYESLETEMKSVKDLAAVDNMFAGLRAQKTKNEAWIASVKPADLSVGKNPKIAAALDKLNDQNVRDTVAWLSSYPDRYNKSSNPNVHVEVFAGRLRTMLADSKLNGAVDLIAHRSTQQKSIRLRLNGASKPNEIVVLGGHLDSISWNGKAPGADDNASGSACLLEALRVLLTQGQPERTVEFFWYAGEESGLLGSNEIARQYKQETKNVIGVLQLDMTSIPGAGEFVIGNVTDFTSAWMQDYLKAINTAYLGVRIVDRGCGYACSDHASWHRQGYPAFFPFEGDPDRPFGKIHTPEDVIHSESNFKHALVFSKIALIFAMDMGNSDRRAPL